MKTQVIRAYSGLQRISACRKSIINCSKDPILPIIPPGADGNQPDGSLTDLFMTRWFAMTAGAGAALQ
nr:hypothetical protein [Herbaspirillum sp. ASV7]